jgi:hypothetical protein
VSEAQFGELLPRFSAVSNPLPFERKIEFPFKCMVAACAPGATVGRRLPAIEQPVSNFRLQSMPIKGGSISDVDVPRE